jgi:hypothetical protein
VESQVSSASRKPEDSAGGCRALAEAGRGLESSFKVQTASDLAERRANCGSGTGG